MDGDIALYSGDEDKKTTFKKGPPRVSGERTQEGNR
jgi:hypothetical protein